LACNGNNREDPEMTGKALISATAIALLVGATAASADCREELAALEGEGIIKDGSTAPLQEPGEATPQTGGDAAATSTSGEDAGEGEIIKDGSEEPLEMDPAVATSGQDAQAQSMGGETAAEQAEGGAGGTDRAAALEEARAALEAGDEQGCMEALERAQS
jgi:hypothetical protein